MVHDGHGLLHAHKRKREGDFPHKDKTKRFLDRAVYVAGIVGPIMTIPQILKIWVERNAAGVSVYSWIAYAICSSFWLAYGIVHKEKPIIITYTLWIILDIFIIIGTFMYG
ncbi:hypothetical protein H8D36_07350 [archaeon]|nr:hypothetical protein [archaeon]MBL7057661.1 hypothetical protein [Candidatus Woesearchaeota archaeon]